MLFFCANKCYFK